MGLTPATQFLLPDEKAYWLLETWRRTPVGDRRIQRIYVLRGDAIAVHEADLGPWDRANDMPFQALGLWEYSVAEIQAQAERGREIMPPDDDEPIDLIKVWAKELDEKRMQRDHISTSGPYFRKERT